MLLNSCINWENSTLAVASLALACVILRAELRHVGLQIVLRDQKSKEGFKYQSVEIY